MTEPAILITIIYILHVCLNGWRTCKKLEEQIVGVSDWQFNEFIHNNYLILL